MKVLFWICFFLVIAAITIALAVVQSKHIFVCHNCGKEFKPKWTQLLCEIHVCDEHLIECPYCNNKSYCRDIGKKN